MASIPNVWAVYINGVISPNTTFKVPATAKSAGEEMYLVGQTIENLVNGDIITIVNQSGSTNGVTADGVTINASVKINKIA